MQLCSHDLTQDSLSCLRSWVLIPERLATHADPCTRVFFGGIQNQAMRRYAAAGYDLAAAFGTEELSRLHLDGTPLLPVKRGDSYAGKVAQKHPSS